MVGAGKILTVENLPTRFIFRKEGAVLIVEMGRIDAPVPGIKNNGVLNKYTSTAASLHSIVSVYPFARFETLLIHIAPYGANNHLNFK